MLAVWVLWGRGYPNDVPLFWVCGSGPEPHNALPVAARIGVAHPTTSAKLDIRRLFAPIEASLASNLLLLNLRQSRASLSSARTLGCGSVDGIAVIPSMTWSNSERSRSAMTLRSGAEASPSSRNKTYAALGLDQATDACNSHPASLKQDPFYIINPQLLPHYTNNSTLDLDFPV